MQNLDFTEQIAPFRWGVFEGIASVTLYASEKYKHKLFMSRKKEGFRGNGYDWESLAMVFIREIMPDLLDKIIFDPETGMFCAYSENFDALERFAISFKLTCENDSLLKDLFSRAQPQKPATKEEYKKVWERIISGNK